MTFEQNLDLCSGNDMSTVDIMMCTTLVIVMFTLSYRLNCIEILISKSTQLISIRNYKVYILRHLHRFKV